MARVKSRNTAPEMIVRRLLTAMGYRYRLHRRDMPGTPDIAFVRRRAAVFVHGCFWHGHGRARWARAPKTNVAYWRDKIARNRARDAKTAAALTALGWRALTVWECELRDRVAVAARLRDFLERPRPG